MIIIFFATLIFQFDQLWSLTSEIILIPLKSKMLVLAQNEYYLIAFALIMVAFILLFLKFRKKNKGLFSNKITGLLTGFADGLKSVKNINRPYAFIFQTFFMWLMYVSSIYVGFLCFNETSRLGVDAAFAVLIFSTLGVIFVPGGTGATQALVTETLTSIFKISFTFAFAFAWLMWTSQFILILFLGVISLILLPILNKGVNTQKD